MSRATALRTLALVCASFLTPVSQAADTSHAGVTLSGPGSVGVYSMSGGEIKIGLTPDEVKALEKTTAKEAVVLLTPILTRINAQIAQLADTRREDKIALGVAEAFLATIKGKKIPTSEWSVEFGEATRSYLRLGASIEATPVTSERIGALVSRADAMRRKGDFAEADAVLAEAAEMATKDAEQVQQRALTSARQAASLYASRANLAFARLERRQGAIFLERAFELRKNDVSIETVSWLVDAGRAWMTDGNSTAALHALSTAQDAATSRVAAKPDSLDWQRTLSVTYMDIGDIQRDALGDTEAALKNYQASLELAERLAAGDPGNARAQRDLLISYLHTAELQAWRGDYSSAITKLQAALAIADHQSASNPADVLWQRDKFATRASIANVQGMQGHIAAAFENYKTALTIAQGLSANDPANAQWQIYVARIHGSIGNIEALRSHSAEALKNFEASLAIREHLAGTDPGNTQWLDSVASDYERIGDLQAYLGEFSEASTSMNAGLAIRQRLAQVDARNARWQDDLSTCFEKLGAVQVAQGAFSMALAGLQASIVIRKRLADSDPHAARWQRSLSEAYDDIGDAQIAAGDFIGARKSFQEGLELRERLSASDSRNSIWQRDVAVSYGKLGDVDVARGDLAAALERYHASLSIRERLAAGSPKDIFWQIELARDYGRIGDLLNSKGDQSAALISLQSAAAIWKRLIASYPENAKNLQWQVYLSETFGSVGEAQFNGGDKTEAAKSYQASLELRNRVSELDPSNLLWQRAIATSCWKLANLGEVYVSVEKRRELLQQGLSILIRLSGPNSSQGSIAIRADDFQKALDGLR